MSYARPAWVEVDLDSVRANVVTLKALLDTDTELMAVVKADGYGHGMLEIAEAALAAGADRLGVSLLEEGEALRSAGIDAPAHVLSELPSAAAGRAIGAELDITTGRAETIQALSDTARTAGRQARVHLKVDTGMGRIGCRPQDALELARLIDSDPGLSLAGVMTHFATSEEPDGEAFRDQMAVWATTRKTFGDAGISPETWHAANSGATILAPETQLDMVRCGIAVYGLHPGPATKQKVDLLPALTLYAQVSHVKRVGTGQGVSYGHTWRAERPTTVATLPIGYGDGYTRRLSNLGHGVLGGRRLPIVGNVTMDQVLVEVPDDLEVSAGDTVTLIGPGVDADGIADLLGTINYEVTCMLNARLPRRYVGAGSGTSSVGEGAR